MFELLKLMTRVSAHNHKATRSMKQHFLATRIVIATRPLEYVKDWKEFCAAPSHAGVKEMVKRVRTKLKAWRLRKGFGMKKKTLGMKKRTLFTRLFGGVKLFGTQAMKDRKGMK